MCSVEGTRGELTSIDDRGVVSRLMAVQWLGRRIKATPAQHVGHEEDKGDEDDQQESHDQYATPMPRLVDAYEPRIRLKLVVGGQDALAIRDARMVGYFIGSVETVWHI